MLKNWKKKLSKKGVITIAIVIIAIITIATILFNQTKTKTRKKKIVADAELARAMTYDEFGDGEENIDGTENVKFGAFFLRDINNDGYAEKIKGTCKQIGKEDTLYMELNVLSDGYFENGVITINSDNFYLQTAIPKDNEVKENTISNNTKQIPLNKINNGTQKLLTGIVRSGNYSYHSSKYSALGNDISKYSKINSVTLTGTHVASDGTRTEINKTIDFNIDWYGTAKTEIPEYLLNENNMNQTRDNTDVVDENNQQAVFHVTVGTQEVNNNLLLSSANLEGTIPQLNGYDPIKVELEDSESTMTYDEATRKFKITKNAQLSENKIVSECYNDRVYSGVKRYNKFNFKVIYSLEAYNAAGFDTVELKIPVQAYYEGYNNNNTEFDNPYRSNIASATIVTTYIKPLGKAAIFEVNVGKHIYSPVERDVVSKEKPLKIYNGVSSEENDDTYIVRWQGSTGGEGNAPSMILKETADGASQVSDEFEKSDSSMISMENITSNIGIYFSNPVALLGEDGWIRVYDEETGEVVHEFNKEDWQKYSSDNPYKYEKPVKHIKIVTSATNVYSTIFVYNIKKLDDEYITSNYTREEFDDLRRIYSTLTGYLDDKYITTDRKSANYEAPYSIAQITLSKDKISTQETEKDMQIKIQTLGDERLNQQKWTNGAFLVKLPKDIINLDINSVEVDSASINIDSYEVYESNGERFIKIITSNKSPAEYTITINCDITPDPRKETTVEYFELYASNEGASEYYNSTEDIYDVNDNLNKTEKVGKRSESISLISPNSLLTNQVASDYDEKGNITVAPNVALVSKERRQAKVGIEINNNYSSTISEIKILGRVPYEGNKYTISGNDMGSTFSATMSDDGIQLPESLQDIAKVYYSENGEATKDLDDSSNGWTEKPIDFSKVKSYLIDLGDYEMPKNEKNEITYNINIPEGILYNEITYSHHGVYFSLNTTEGKYRTYTEPNKVGFMIAKQYDLELTKYQTGKDNIVSGATYAIYEEGNEEKKTRVTGEDGKLKLTGLYIDRTYVLKEIKSPNDYELNEEVVKFTASESDGKISITKNEGTVKNIKAIQPSEDEGYKVEIEVEDEAKARLKIIKTEKDTTVPVVRAKYKLTKYNSDEVEKIITTNINGEALVTGLKVDEWYTIQEVKAEGYYIDTSKVSFMILNDSGTYKVYNENGQGKEISILEENNFPVVTIKLDDEKIPTYNLEISKIKRITDTAVTEDELKAKAEQALASTDTVYLAGAKFKLYKGDKHLGDYTTDENGKITLTGLYQYIDEKDEDAEYTLKEALAPDGYSKIKDITFKVDGTTGELKLINTNGNNEAYTVDGNTVKLVMEDSPSFKLIKKDAETQETLANIKFAIYNIEDNTTTPAVNSKGEILGTKETINGQEYYTVTTNENGELTADLTEGTYKAVEVQAPDKYDLTNATYYFGIGKSRESKKGLKAISLNTNMQRVIAETSDGGAIAGYESSDKTIDLGNGMTFTNKGAEDIIILKYSAEYEIEWANTIGGTSHESIRLIAECKDGGILVGGSSYSDSIDLENGNSLAEDKGHEFLVKYSAEGRCEWAKNIPIEGFYALSVCEDGGMLVGGYFTKDNIDLGDGITLSKEGTSNVGIIIKYNSNGKCEFAKKIEGATVQSVKETSDGGIVAGGYFGGNTNLGNGVTVSGIGSGDGIIVKYNSNLECQWAKVIGGTFHDEVQSVTQINDGGIVAGGYFQSKRVELEDGTILTNQAYQVGFVIKYTADGEIAWVHMIGYKGYDDIALVEKSRDGGILVAGNLGPDGIEDLGIKPHGQAGDGVIIKYNEKGELQWAKAIGGKDNTDSIHYITESIDGKILAEFYLSSSQVNLDNGLTVTKPAGVTGSEVLIKFEEVEVDNPVVVQAKGIGSEKEEYIQSAKATSDGGIIAGGRSFSESIDLGNGITIKNKGKADEFGTRKADAILIKYKENGECEWAKDIGGNEYDEIKSVTETSDKGIIAGGNFYSTSINIENGITLTNKGNKDSFIIKYNSKGEYQWSKAIGGEDFDEIVSVSECNDGGILVGGRFDSNIVDIGDGVSLKSDGDIIIKYNSNGEYEWSKTIELSISSVKETSNGEFIVSGGIYQQNVDLGNNIIISSKGSYDGIIIKYDSSLECQWAKVIGGEEYDELCSITETTDGGIVAGGYFGSSSITLEDGTTFTNTSSSTLYDDAILVKYNSEGKLEWTKKIGGSSGERITSVEKTIDGGILIGGSTGSSDIDLGSDAYISTAGGFIAKYSTSGECEWAKGIGKSSYNGIYEVSQNSNGEIVAGGYFQDKKIDFGNDITIANNGNTNGVVLKIINQVGVPETQELIVENTRKEFKITTDVQEIDGIKGGAISGEDEQPYETVKYGDSSTKEIKMTPDENYEIIKITVNGQEYPFKANQDGTYTIPAFTNMTEDKRVVVTYALKDNKIIINKIDSKTKEKLSGVKFKLDQIEERSEPENVIGKLTDNGQEYVKTTLEDEVSEKFGELTNNGSYNFVQNEDGTYTPTNSKTYQSANGGSSGISSSTASSYIPIDLTNETGKYVVIVNASCSSERNYDIGYATITEYTSLPSYDETTGRFIYISGTQAAKDYQSMTLEGGKKYYLHFGYCKDSSSDSGNDQIVINSVKLYNANVTSNTYNFINNNGKYESTNQGQDDTTTYSYVPIDLTNCTGKYNLTVNAEISSQYADYGYATVTENTTRAEKEDGKTVLIISGTDNSARDYSVVLQGGKMYYLHLGYSKDSSKSIGDDKFIVNSIQVTLNDSELYHTTVETNSEGQAITQIPFGKYKVTETKAPEGYLLNETPTEIEFRSTSGAVHEFTIENEATAKVIVHHYIKGTTTKLAEDETVEGKAGESYTTSPKLDLEKYELEKDDQGNSIIPDNAIGTYTEGTTEVTYYYVEKEIPLTVRHYIKGTTIRVPLKDGTEAQDVTSKGKEGESYTTEPLADNLSDDYELAITPSNATGTYAGSEVIVTYYYSIKKAQVNITKIDDDGNPVEGAGFKIYNKYEEKTDFEELTNNGPGYVYIDPETGKPSKSTEEVTVKNEIITREEFNQRENITDDTQYGSFVEKDGIYEATPTYDENNNLLKSSFVLYVDTEGYKDDYCYLDLGIEVNGGTVNIKNHERFSTEEIDTLNSYTGSKNYELVFLKDWPCYIVVDYTYDDVNTNYIKISKSVFYNAQKEQYGFRKEESGEYVSENKGREGTVAKSYTLIDLSDKTDDYELNLTSTISSKENHDFGYINLYDNNDNLIKQIAKTSGTKENEQYKTILQGGKIYKLEFVYEKEENTEIYSLDSENGIQTYSSIDDTFRVTKISLNTYTNKTGETDADGKLSFDVEPGDYVLIETKVPDGYDPPENVSQDVTVTKDGADLTIVNNKHRGKVIVHHYIEGTTTPVPLKDGTTAQDETLKGEIGTQYLTKEINENSTNYTVTGLPDNASGKFIEGTIEVTYYYVPKSTSVLVHYYEEGTTNKLSEDKRITGKIDDDYTTESATDIPSKYELVSVPENKTGKMTEDEITVIYYYRKKATKVIVHYYEEGTTNKLSEDVEITGKVDDDYTTESATDVPIKYELVSEPTNKTGTMTEDTIEVIYYYKVKNSLINVRYLEKGTDEQLAEPTQQHGKVDEEYQTEPKEIEGYQLVEHSGNEKGKFEIEPLTITYYYLYKTKATVQYIDKDTGEILEQSTTEGLVGDNFVTESKNFENYILVEEPEEKTIKMTKEEQVLKYYYTRISGGVIEKHIDEISGEILANEEHKGNAGDEYDIPSRTFEGYDLVEDKLPENAKGKITGDLIEVIYYYKHQAKVTAEYIDKVTGEKLTEDEIQTGHEKDSYTTERKTFDDYKLVEEPSNADGEMTKEDITVSYYYVHISGGVIINHIDIKTGKQLLDETKQEGYEGDPYETHEENIPEYELVEDQYPENATGTMTIEPTRVTYYYIKKTGVKVKYVDQATGEEIEETIEITGKEGDEYTTEPKDIEGYDIEDEPENKNGTMEDGIIEVIYYYKRPAKVIVNHYDEATNEKIAEEETIEGHQNDEYTTEQKKLKYYKLTKEPENKDGKMDVKVTKDENGKDVIEDTIYVNYYYRKLIFNMKIDKTIESVAVNNLEQQVKGDLGKVEIYRKDMATAKVQVKYKITVTNDSEIDGKAIIKEDLPKGMTMKAEYNAGWKIQGTIATMETEQIKAGETKEYIVVLDWNNGDNNIGMKENVAMITTENEAGFAENDTTDNQDNANVIVAVGTGNITYTLIMYGVLLIAMSVVGGLYIVKKVGLENN